MLNKWNEYTRIYKMNTAGGQAVDHQGGDSQWYLLVFPGVLSEIS